MPNHRIELKQKVPRVAILLDLPIHPRLHAHSRPRAEIAAAEEVRRVFGDEVDEALDRFNALALPTLREAPLPLREAGDASRALATSSLVRPFNLSGHPALNIPFTLPSGLPAGLQLVGRKGADASLCALARCIAPLG